MATVGPHHFDIRPWQSWQSTQGTWVRQNGNYFTRGRMYNSTVVGGDNIFWDLPLTAGTWSFFFLVEQNAVHDNAMAVTLDGVSIGTVNMTAATSTTLAGVTVATDGIKRFQLACSANGKYVVLQHIAISRTA